MLFVQEEGGTFRADTLSFICAQDGHKRSFQLVLTSKLRRNGGLTLQIEAETNSVFLMILSTSHNTMSVRMTMEHSNEQQKGFWVPTWINA